MAYKLLVGGYTQGGLRVVTFDPSNNKLDLQSTGIPVGPDPSWIVQHPRDSSLILATSEVEDGKLHVIRLKDGEELSGEVLTSVSSGGTYPAHLLVLDDSIVTGNYMGGSILDIPYSLGPVSVKDHGSEKAQGVHIQFSGTGPNPDRQESSHPHEVYLHGNELLIPDLGADKTWRLVKGDSGWEIKGAIEYPAGSGPRHVLIHDGILYTVLELSNEIALHKFVALPETPSPIAVLSTFASGSPADPSMLAAEILLSPDKRFIYVSNRNDPSPEGDTLAVYTVHSDKQECKLVNEIRTGVKHARGMKFSKDGTYLAVAGSHTGSLKIFKVVEGSSNGEVTAVASVEGLEKPTAVVWL